MRDSTADSLHRENDARTTARRRFLVGGATALASVPLLGSARAFAQPRSIADPAQPPVPDDYLPGPDEALQWLVEGNERWVSGQLLHPHQTVARRMAVAAGQHPLATVFSCIDSRVPPEIVFDRGVGDLFVVRTAAQTNDGLIQGAVEYGAEESVTPLVVVMGHQRCGAVTLAVEALNNGTDVPAHLVDVVEALTPAYDAAKPLPGDQVDNTVRAQIRLTADQLREDPLLAPLVGEQRVRVVGAYYSLDTGCVEFMLP
ncbi:carbonic anhydrase [Kitasatospora mediocidica]|uniref:carbonic anhydrase n=1 Tax=Kitasatospora mediocidica TaxID=58352 RepID=UPI00068BF977|nr:carbonic anhydrase [Kitasatospora mediocidica]